MRALLCIVVAATTAALLLAAAKASSQDYGKLTQLPGRAGCISAAGNTDGCEIFPPLSGASSVAVSPDGRNVYTTGYHGDAVVSFRRDPATGALSLLDGQAACFSKESWGGLCQRGYGLDGASAVVVSPDGRNVYAAGSKSDAVAVFWRMKDGTLSQLAPPKGCISKTGSGGDCFKGRALDDPIALLVPPGFGGMNLYVASARSNAIAMFYHRRVLAELTQFPGSAGCLSSTGSGGDCIKQPGLDGAAALTASQDGRSVYVAAAGSKNVTAFSRTASLTPLQAIGGVGTGLTGERALEVSPEGQFVDVGGFFKPDGRDRIWSFRRQAAGNLSGGGAAGDSESLGVSGLTAMASSPDGANVFYAVGRRGNVIWRLHRDNHAGLLWITDRVIAGGQNGRALRGPTGVAVSPDGRNVYVTSADSGAIAVFARATS